MVEWECALVVGALYYMRKNTTKVKLYPPLTVQSKGCAPAWNVRIVCTVNITGLLRKASCEGAHKHTETRYASLVLPEAEVLGRARLQCLASSDTTTYDPCTTTLVLPPPASVCVCVHACQLLSYAESC